jgi:hypothetical protein
VARNDEARDAAVLKVLLGVGLALITIGVALIPLPGPGPLVVTRGVVVAGVAAVLRRKRPEEPGPADVTRPLR